MSISISTARRPTSGGEMHRACAPGVGGEPSTPPRELAARRRDSRHIAAGERAGDRFCLPGRCRTTWDTLLGVTAEIRYDPEAVAFTVDGDHGIPISRDDAVVAPLDVVRDVEVAGFERALIEYEDKDGATTGYVFLCDVAVEKFDPDLSNRDVALTFLGGQLSAQPPMTSATTFPSSTPCSCSLRCLTATTPSTTAPTPTIRLATTLRSTRCACAARAAPSASSPSSALRPKRCSTPSRPRAS
jgi:hypothetical protein